MFVWECMGDPGIPFTKKKKKKNSIVLFEKVLRDNFSPPEQDLYLLFEKVISFDNNYLRQ